MADLLTPDALATAAASLPHWTLDGDTLRRSVTCEDFRAAIRLVDAIAVEAEALDHHPDMDIRYRTVHLTLSTHSAGGITTLDVELAHRVDALAGG